MSKICTACRTSKDVSAFSPRRGRASSYSQCRDCRNAQARALHDPLKCKAELLKARFGISLDQYNHMFVHQGGCCGICAMPQSAFIKAFAVDHCHKTHKIRGLLCDKCNRAIGLLNDSSEAARKAAEYLDNAQPAVDNVIPLFNRPTRFQRKVS